jgi:hypothetical protein
MYSHEVFPALSFPAPAKAKKAAALSRFRLNIVSTFAGEIYALLLRLRRSISNPAAAAPAIASDAGSGVGVSRNAS